MGLNWHLHFPIFYFSPRLLGHLFVLCMGSFFKPHEDMTEMTDQTYEAMNLLVFLSCNPSVSASWLSSLPLLLHAGQI